MQCGTAEVVLLSDEAPTPSSRMPRYFFSLESSSGTTLDDDGEELTDDAAAHAAAPQTARELGNWNRMNHASVRKWPYRYGSAAKPATQLNNRSNENAPLRSTRKRRSPLPRGLESRWFRAVA